MVHSKPLRFVVLRHEVPATWAATTGRDSHFDLMLEQESLLKTWALSQWPLPWHTPQPLELLPDHRLIYLEYEGPLSGQRGQVSRVDQGTYEIVRQENENLVVLLYRESADQPSQGTFQLHISPQAITASIAD